MGGCETDGVRVAPSARGGSRNLVVVRAGDSSLHPMWLAGPETPDFDLIVSYFGDDPDQFRAPWEARVDQKGGKWDGLAVLFAARPELLDRYDFFWLPDDDIATDARTINRIFVAMRRLDLALAQPGLTLDSHFTYIGYLRSRSFALRYASAIEIMAPCVRTDVLQRVLPLIADLPSGWGLDPVWTRLTADNRRKSAILDQLPVKHTRPLGKVLRAAMSAAGRNASSDLDEMRRCFGRLRLYPLIYEALDRRGHVWTDRRAIALRMATDLVLERSRIAHYSSAKDSVFELLRRQAYHLPNLAQLVSQ